MGIGRQIQPPECDSSIELSNAIAAVARLLDGRVDIGHKRDVDCGVANDNQTQCEPSGSVAVSVTEW